MRRLLFSLTALVAATAMAPIGVSADVVGQTQATLTCTDGHSVNMALNQSQLTNLLGEVQALNASGLTTCAVATAPSGETTEWTVYDYNPSDQAIAPRNSPNKMPATTTGSTTVFNFKDGVYTALLTTTDPTLTGDLSGRSLQDTITLSGDPAAVFVSQHGDGCDAPATARFYFRAPSASGSSVGTPPAGFYTQFWWSNPIAVPLGAGEQGPITINADMFNAAEWSDWNGQNGATQPEAFAEATQKVQAIGLSFGGGCFFENGVTALNNGANSEQLSSNFTES